MAHRASPMSGWVEGTTVLSSGNPVNPSANVGMLYQCAISYPALLLCGLYLILLFFHNLFSRHLVAMFNKIWDSPWLVAMILFVFQKYHSNSSHISLLNISLSSSGRYRCEVSAEGPSFQTVTDHGDMLAVGECATIFLSSFFLLQNPF